MDLTTTEKEIIRLVADGYTEPEIAELTKYSKNSVHVIRHRIMKRLGAKNTPHMVSIAYQQGILEVPTSLLWYD